MPGGWTVEKVHGLVPFVTEGVGGMMAVFAHLEAEHTICHVDDQPFIMSDHTERRPHLLRQLFKGIANVERSRAIHRSGGLISEHQRGRWMSARAIATRCRWPVERNCGFFVS